MLIGYEGVTLYMEAGSCNHEAVSIGVFHLLVYTSLHRAIPELGPITPLCPKMHQGWGGVGHMG